MGVYVTEGDIYYHLRWHSFYVSDDGAREVAWGGAYRFEGCIRWIDGKGWAFR